MLLTVPEAAKVLRCGPATVYRLCRENATFPVIKLNPKCFRIPEEALKQWIAQTAQSALKGEDHR